MTVSTASSAGSAAVGRSWSMSRSATIRAGVRPDATPSRMTWIRASTYGP